MSTPLRAAVIALLPVSSLLAQPQGRNPHVFYNTQKTQFATRATSTVADQIFFTQPLAFHNNAQRGMGWEVVIQDQQVATSETIYLSWHAVQADGVTPVVTPIATDEFTLFGIGTGTNAFIFTLTTANPVELPQQVALGVHLPAPHPFPADAALLHYQRGDNLQVPAPAMLLQQWSWAQSGAAAVPAFVKGSTFHFGGVYDRPVIRGYVNTTAYGVGAENLAGPEALWPFPVRGDRYSLQVIGDRYKSLATQQPSACCIFLSPAYAPAPIPSPFGPVLLQPSSTTHFFTAAMNVNGVLTIPPLPLPKKAVTACFAAALANFMTNEVSFTNAIRIDLIHF